MGKERSHKARWSDEGNGRDMNKSLDGKGDVLGPEKVRQVQALIAFERGGVLVGPVLRWTPT